MKTLYFLIILTCTALSLSAQNNGFKFGVIQQKELEMTVYEKDSSAAAVVLDEFGDRYFANGSYHLITEKHYKIKILKAEGLKQADLTLFLVKGAEGHTEELTSIQVSSFTLDEGAIHETKVTEKDIKTIKDKYFDTKKVAIPNVKVGSIIEVQYTIKSPFVYNMKDWAFQTDIPKIKSECWVRVPENHPFRITLKGFLKLAKRENTIIRQCHNQLYAAMGDCIQYKFAMTDIPAMAAENYIADITNFRSAIVFDIAVQTEWKNFDTSLRESESFGEQLRKGKDVYSFMRDEVETIADSLTKAKKIYDLIVSNFTWNGQFGKYTDGIKKAYERKKGDAADLNLCLAATLRYCGYNVEPIVMSTRDNGTPIELYPVLDVFNYVITKLKLGGKTYLLDATDPLLPFGMLPFHCLNGQGRSIPIKNPSYWYALKPTEKFKTNTMINLVLDSTGTLRGTMEITAFGYDALQKRKELKMYSNQDVYVDSLKRSYEFITIKKIESSGFNAYDQKFVQKFEIEIEPNQEPSDETFFFNPFVINKLTKNPFQPAERLYPVDFGAPRESLTIVTLTYPSSYTAAEKPANVGLTLPNQGGRFVFNVTNQNNKLTMTEMLSLTQPSYSSVEYHYLRELYQKILQVHNSDILLKKTD